jgi:hypothetical protein
MESSMHPDQTYGMSARSSRRREEGRGLQADLLPWCNQGTQTSNLRASPKVGGVGIIHMDMRKAFDCVDIDFIIDARRRFGIGEKFFRWICLFYRGSSRKVMLNGHIC